VDRFDTAKANVVNRAIGGFSNRTYLTLGHWDRVLAMLKPGDVVLRASGNANPPGESVEPAGRLGSARRWEPHRPPFWE